MARNRNADEGSDSLVKHARQRLLLNELKDRSLWCVRVRWWVPPGVAAGVAIGRGLEIDLPVLPLLGVALLILGYNLFFARWHRRFAHEPAMQYEELLRAFTRWQVVCDFAAMFLVVHFTGGGASPFVFFFVIHIIFSSILLRHGTAHAFSAAAALGMGLLTAAEHARWLPSHPLLFRGAVPVTLTGQALPWVISWGFFAASVLVASWTTTSIMELVRRRIWHLAELSETVLMLNTRLQSLHTITQSIVASRKLDEVLSLLCTELSRVLEVQGVSIKLLSEDGATLRYTAAHGLPSTVTPGREIDVARSPLNLRIMQNEPFAAGRVTQDELLQLGEEFRAHHVQSVLFVPMRRGDHIVGILGAYAREPERFRRDDVDFMRVAAELAALALDNAAAYEAVETVSREREQFLYRVAHNLRAPLAAMVSMITVIRDGYVGELSANQREYLSRVERRAEALGQLVNELLTLASSQGARRKPARERVDLTAVAAKVGRTFRERAAERGLQFVTHTPPDPATVAGDAALLEQMCENLVSNAIKYTPSGGLVTLAVEPAGQGQVRLMVSDTGIGISEEDRGKLFTEFFRADNARQLEVAGTGLGLVIVREIATQHGGQVAVESAERRGTTFTVTLPALA